MDVLVMMVDGKQRRPDSDRCTPPFYSFLARSHSIMLLKLRGIPFFTITSTDVARSQFFLSSSTPGPPRADLLIQHAVCIASAPVPAGCDQNHFTKTRSLHAWGKGWNASTKLPEMEMYNATTGDVRGIGDRNRRWPPSLCTNGSRMLSERTESIQEEDKGVRMYR